jgi:hypothetical protein
MNSHFGSKVNTDSDRCWSLKWPFILAGMRTADSASKDTAFTKEESK